MPNDDDRLAQWWSRLSPEEQAEALESQRTGQLTNAMWSSLQGTGVIAPGGRGKPPKVPRNLVDFLKMRH